MLLGRGLFTTGFQVVVSLRVQSTHIRGVWGFYISPSSRFGLILGWCKFAGLEPHSGVCDPLRSAAAAYKEREEDVAKLQR